MKFLQFILEISWRNIGIAIITGFLSGSGNAMLIVLINRSLHQASLSNALVYFAALAVLTVVTNIISQFVLIHLSQNAIYRLRMWLSKTILSSPLQHLEQLGNNRLLATMIEDVRFLSQSICAIPSVCIDLATVLGCLGYIAYLSGVVFATTVATTAIAIWGVQTQLGRARSLLALAREEEDNLLKQFQAISAGIKELKLNRNRRDDFISNNLQASASKLRHKNMTAMKNFAIANGFGQFSQFATLGIILFILPALVNIPLPMLSTYVLTTTFLALPMQNILNRLPDFTKGNIALQKIERMKLSLFNNLEHESENFSYIKGQVLLKLDGVSYLYQQENHKAPPPHKHHPHHGKLPIPPMREIEQTFYLGAINLSLQPGEITYIIGGNGSGKSTLAKLITGLYTPDKGSIYLNGTQIDDYNREWYRQHFSAIFSDFYLFESCLGFNHKNLDRDVERYLRKLQLDHKVQVKNGVLSTTMLSQGQRKRLALLVAFLEDRPIYVFDEWASDQEPMFREIFYQEILVELKERGKTVIVITHDDRYYHLADRIIKLDYGKVISDEVSNGRVPEKHYNLQ
ncbi:ABC transporter ATP-binding protein [Calothrix sp. HK-06]|nr:ABC transporter ATP-binding protein [Calothrix sp. HK-06]